MGSYAVRLLVHTEHPLSRAQLEGLDADRHDLSATGNPRGRTLVVSITMAGSDVVGALARSLNVVLDAVPGTVRSAEVVVQPSRPTKTRRRRR